MRQCILLVLLISTCRRNVDLGYASVSCSQTTHASGRSLDPAARDSCENLQHCFALFVLFRLNIFYCISQLRDWTQVITTLDSPFPNITTDYISYNGGYNNVYSIHIQSHIPSSSHTVTPLLLKQYCKEGVWTGMSIIQTFVSL